MDSDCDNISDFDLQGLVDGAFDSETHEKLMDAIKKRPILLNRLGSLFYQKQMLKDWWRSQPLT